MVQGLKNKFWVRYDAEGSVTQLYRLTLPPGVKFQRWEQGNWADADDWLERVTQDAAYDEVGVERAHQILNDFAERRLANNNCNIDASSHQAIPIGLQESFGGNIARTVTTRNLGNDSIADGFSALATSAIAMHEVFLGFVSAGFTEDQALKIITGLIRSD